jgi:hypothetical protein
METSKMIKWMDREPIFGAMAKHIKENGRTIDCMDKENFIGLMDLITTESMKMMKDMAKEL